jgi:Ca2+-binding EF-hand superfamily protein
MKFYDTDGDGNVSYDEFLRGLRYEYKTVIKKKYRDPLSDRK